MEIIKEILQRVWWLGLSQRREEQGEQCAVQANIQYVHAVPWIALLLLLLRSFLEKSETSSVPFFQCRTYRLLLCRYVFHWMGESLCHMSDHQCCPPPHNTVLRVAFKENRRPSLQEVWRISQKPKQQQKKTYEL